ncbi:flagellar hook-length control protein FliK [Vibrio zhugei]|uniref:Flagellar hook-length control protein FliK n=1 Tax=Vibrio zhugei TaxID=2479546 RepID=A0ABV7CC69_9VIBR|nr:flagellar hook-length control protein FliK [Vibrio zhugei]
MNINTSQSTDSLKGTEITGSGASKGDKKETSEASGFFDKLTALMFGSSEQTKGKIAGKLLQAKASDGGNDPMAALKKLGWTKHQLEHLTEKELSKVANQQGIEVAELKSIIQQMPDVMTAKPALASAKNAQSSDADKTDIPAAMDEGKQLLGKLQQANQTLTKPASQVAHGKDLPQKVGVTAAEPVAPALQKNKLVHTGKEDESTTFAERPISQKELAQLVALKKQHPELSESDLKKQLVAQRIKQDEMTESETASLGVSHHASPNQPVVMTNAATASAEKGGGVSYALHKGAQPSPIQTQSASVTVQTGMSEHKLSPQGNMVTPQDGGATGLPSQSQQQTTASPLGQGANPLVAASLMATNAAKGAPSNVIEKGLSEKALNAMTEMKGAKRGTSSPESSLAAQLSSASGQSLSATQKVDGTQQAASPQLQLSKDGADQVAEKVHMMMSKNLKSIDIRLDPPEMGKMHIKMQMNNDGGATVHFTVASHHARDALEQSMPRLREMLSQQGVQLGGTSVQQDGGSQQQSFASANGGQSQSQSQRQAGRGVAGGTQENFDGDIKLDLNVASKRDGISYYA